MTLKAIQFDGNGNEVYYWSIILHHVSDRCVSLLKFFYRNLSVMQKCVRGDIEHYVDCIVVD